MAKCRFCGKPCGFGQTHHESCYHALAGTSATCKYCGQPCDFGLTSHMNCHRAAVEAAQNSQGGALGANGGDQPSGPGAPTDALVATCPRCASPSVQAVALTHGNAVDAALTEAMLGTAAGVAVGTRAEAKAMCLKCGLQWQPGTKEEQRIRALSGQLGAARKRKEEDAVREEREKNKEQLLFGCIGCLAIVVILALMTGCAVVVVVT